MKLRDFTVGDTVTLKGAGATDQPLFIGDVARDGHYLLWKNREARMDDKPWEVAAAGSHEISKGVVG